MFNTADRVKDQIVKSVKKYLQYNFGTDECKPFEELKRPKFNFLGKRSIRSGEEGYFRAHKILEMLGQCKGDELLICELKIITNPKGTTLSKLITNDLVDHVFKNIKKTYTFGASTGYSGVNKTDLPDAIAKRLINAMPEASNKEYKKNLNNGLIVEFLRNKFRNTHQTLNDKIIKHISDYKPEDHADLGDCEMDSVSLVSLF